MNLSDIPAGRLLGVRVTHVVSGRVTGLTGYGHTADGWSAAVYAIVTTDMGDTIEIPLDTAVVHPDDAAHELNHLTEEPT